MICEAQVTPAKLIKEFRKQINSEKPVLKGAFIEESTYIGNDQLECPVNLKTKMSLSAILSDYLQSPAK
jgi:large subunit ribosomal protein L10